MKKRNKTLLTAALGGLVLAATVSMANAEEEAATASGEKAGQCHGINACKGTGACHSADYSCAGKNACKGQGWLKTTKAECDEKGGTFKE